jgi:hypothetical protein
MKAADKFNRSKIANRSKLLPGLDGRSKRARRFRDLVDSFSEPLGNFEQLPEEVAALVRMAAFSILAVEAQQASGVAGEPLDLAELHTLTETLERQLNTLMELAG